MHAVVILLGALALVAAGCGGGEDGVGGSAAPAEPGPVHIHGLGVNPADGALFIATHTGLWRVPAGGDRAERVGDSRQDTMGFTVVGPDHFLGSGHPDLRQMQEDNLPPHLGLIASRDGGRSWTSVALLGEADFHVLRAEAGLILGVNATSGELMRSRDGGRRWSPLATPVPFFDVVAAPGEPMTLVAAGEEGLYRSPDAGRRWRRLGATTGLLAWPQGDALYLVTAGGDVAVSSDHGATFSSRGHVGESGAFLATGADTLYVALHDGTVKVSRDGGRTWAVRSGA